MRNKQRKLRRKKRFLRFNLLLLFLIGLFFVNKKVDNKFETKLNFDEMLGSSIVQDASGAKISKPQKFEGEALDNKLLQLSRTSDDYQKIYNHKEEYPEELINAVCNNSELLDFALGYPNADKTANGGFKKEEKKEKIPMIFQWDKRWGYAPYGESCIGLAGCAPTCISMVAYSLTGNADVTPDKVAEYAMNNGYYQDGVGTSWSFMTEGVKEFGIEGTEISLDKNIITTNLKEGHPVICSMRPGDFTSTGHFIVITDIKDGKFVIHDPNSKARSQILWDYDKIESQIKNLWSYN